MNKNVFEIYSYVKNSFCSNCDVEEGCDECAFSYILNMLENLEHDDSAPSQEGCHICLTKQGRSQEVFYDDGRGGLRIAEYCPLCGRKISG